MREGGTQKGHPQGGHLVGGTRKGYPFRMKLIFNEMPILAATRMTMMVMVSMVNMSAFWVLVSEKASSRR